jgi:hypothetical protein
MSGETTLAASLNIQSAMAVVKWRSEYLQDRHKLFDA